jgi:PAS domain S-box-containing protein
MEDNLTQHEAAYSGAAIGERPLVVSGSVGCDQVDLWTVIRVSQAVSSEIELDRLLDVLLRTALEQSGAVRALLVLLHQGEVRVRAEADCQGDEVVVRLVDKLVEASAMPLTVLHHVLRAKELVILDDAAAHGSFAMDAYVRARQAKSVLCVPLVLRGRLTGALYLENSLVPRAFEPGKIAVVKIVASQAATSLENTQLYRDLALRETRIRRLVDANIVGVFVWDVEGRILEANDAFLRLIGYEKHDLADSSLRWTELIPPEWVDHRESFLSKLRGSGSLPPFETNLARKDGSRAPVLLGLATFEGDLDRGVAFVLDLAERKRAEEVAQENEQRYRAVQTELAHANRVATMGQLTASIAHEVKQPIGAMVANADAARRWLSRDPPNTEEVQKALTNIANDGMRAGEIVSRIQEFSKKAPPRKEVLDINRAIRDVIEITHGEAKKQGVEIDCSLAKNLPAVEGDRVQLQQIILNLVLNALEAMRDLSEGARELAISSEARGANSVLVSVRDTGPGIEPNSMDRVFDPFYTTKSAGFGLGLSICRSIVEAHNGRMWVSANTPAGTVFQFTLAAA